MIPTNRPPTHPFDILIKEFDETGDEWLVGRDTWSDIQCGLVASCTDTEIQFWLNLRDNYEEYLENKEKS